ncbi:nucleoside kinase, partial [uncultured Alistipes sp.]
MADTITVICENLGAPLQVAMGTPLSEVAAKLTPGRYPFLAAYVNNRIKELYYKIYTPVTVRFVDITTFAGIRVYQRTSWFILQKAVRDLFPGQTLHIRHSMGQNGFYCEVEGIDEFTPEQTAALAGRMRELVAQDLPICRSKVLTSEVRARYAEQGFDDKIALLDTRPRLYSDLYTLGDTEGYFYGALAPSTGFVRLFAIEPYYNGFYIALPLRTAPERLNTNVHQEKMFDIFREYQSWVKIMGVPTVGDVNAKVLAGDAGGMIKLAEAFHERKFAEIADAIYDANLSRGMRMVLISGPSSSGKTTSAKRLGIQLGVLGLNPVLISLDDYFVDREKTPKDADGEYDYEALEAIDLELFNDHLCRLMRGESVDIPRYDFVTGRRTWHKDPLTLNERSILIVEGIHGLNPRLTPSVPESQKFRIYISCFTSVALDNLSRIATTDNRLLRRLTRDYTQRGASAVATLSRWASVRRGEEKHIFPYQENADVMLNSSLFYEISVLRPFAEKILREVPDTVPEYDE